MGSLLDFGKKKKENDSDVQEQFKAMITEKRFMELIRLMNRSAQVPTEYVVRMGFKMYMQDKRSNRVKLFFIMKLKEITKVVPEDVILEAIIRITFEMNSPHVLTSLCKRLEIDIGIFAQMYPEIQEAYLGHVKRGIFANVEKLMEITEINPSEEIIQQGYKYYLNEGKLISFTGLKNKTGVKPDRKMVLEIFKLYQERANQYDLDNPKKKGKSNIWKKRIERLRKAMGTKSPKEKDD
ncbi:MAG: hypothetical protein GY757_14080 [bacterium]|nr:hypothetical protein [bacterium]